MRLLIIGKLSGQISQASKIASSRGVKVSHCTDIDSALSMLREGKGSDLVMIDVQFDVARLINALRSEHISVPVVGCGLENDTIRAVEAIKAGAKEYIPLPPDEELIAAILEAITQDASEIICESESMKKVMNMAKQVAPSEASILITGESGTGKEVMARFIHKNSKRASQEIIPLNCAAIPDNLLESELFGHEKGAFTGAVSRRIGKFEEASGSTLLLDEISEMDLKLQAKLLRAIQEREIDRVGGSKPVKVDIRIIATSNKDLVEEVKKGTFRQDLFFRLNVINLELPPLRKRKDDIKHFVEFFVSKYAKLNAIAKRPVSKGALYKLENYSWPGNVRELENAVHRSLLLSSSDEITEGAVILPDDGSNDNENNEESSGKLVGRTVQDVEKELINNTLDHCLGNRTHAANILGISIRTLRNKLQEYQKEAS